MNVDCGGFGGRDVVSVIGAGDERVLVFPLAEDLS